jgi:N-methylhydantoinase A
MKLSEFDAPRIQILLAALQEEATGFVRSCDATAEILSEFKVYMRYSGQGWEIPVVLTRDQALNPDAAKFERLFEEDYAKLFGRTVQGLNIEITVWSVNATTPPETVDKVAQHVGGTTAPMNGNGLFFDPALDQFVSCSRYDRSKLEVGNFIEGPGMVFEDETTIIIPSSRDAIRQPDGCIDIMLKVKG